MSAEYEKHEKDHSLLTSVCMELGGIAESNSHYTSGLTDRIARVGKNIEDLTVRELLAFHHEHNEFFNKVYSR